MYKSFISSIVLTFSLIFVSGCGVIDYYYLPPPEDTAQEIFESANYYMQDKNYLEAIKLYNKLKENYPFSPYTIEAELSLADAYFLDAEYIYATEAYKDFEALHPRDNKIPYVLYQIGMSQLRSFISIDRPTTDIQEAHEYFNRLVQTFPNSEYTTSAKEKMVECRRIMAEHELYIADVFWNMKKYGSAWKRYQFIADNFQETGEIAEHARNKAIASYNLFREAQSSEVRQKREGTWKNWFEWL